MHRDALDQIQIKPNLFSSPQSVQCNKDTWHQTQNFWHFFNRQHIKVMVEGDSLSTISRDWRTPKGGRRRLRGAKMMNSWQEGEREWRWQYEDRGISLQVRGKLEGGVSEVLKKKKNNNSFCPLHYQTTFEQRWWKSFLPIIWRGMLDFPSLRFAKQPKLRSGRNFCSLSFLSSNQVCPYLHPCWNSRQMSYPCSSDCNHFV